MSVVTIGLDLAKTVFQVHGVDEDGITVLRRKLSRADMIAFFTKQPLCVIGMEACSSAHHWARLLVEIGHTVRLVPPQYVKPYVKRNKSDAADAEAICEAVAKPNMRFVPIKTKEQQAVLALHRARSLLVRQRTATINALRGLLGEYGIVAGKGVRQLVMLRERLATAGNAVVPSEAHEALRCLFDHIDALSEKLKSMEERIVAWHKSNPDSLRLATALARVIHEPAALVCPELDRCLAA
ncbi:MAG: family transposase [Novosphingobium lindaniclasticum]|uniref:IS110 family transposase n=1 Tax=Novosphingobium lindaniclasticum TaxID=1329895 RepID=UPI0024098D9F|nr:IS110 family transposase [Novosphingobium lindaniclasticum]MDF2640382.1 family transposase [Novosphingobium lindaniclasticum]